MSELSSHQQRIWEVDCLRGLAVCLMLFSNLTFDLYFFVFFKDPQSGFLPYFARGIAGLFVLLVGVSLTLSSARAGQVGFGKFLVRGTKIFALGMLVTLATRLTVGRDFVIFGVLHLIGASIILAYPFLGRRWLSLGAGLLVVMVGEVLAKITVTYPWLLWLGLQYKGFSSVDYTPLAPWFGLVLIGVFVGQTVYPNGGSRWGRAAWGETLSLFKLLGFCGRHSLKVYLIHQPVFLGLITLLKKMAVF